MHPISPVGICLAADPQREVTPLALFSRDDGAVHFHFKQHAHFTTSCIGSRRPSVSHNSPSHSLVCCSQPNTFCRKAGENILADLVSQRIGSRVMERVPHFAVCVDGSSQESTVDSMAATKSASGTSETSV